MEEGIEGDCKEERGRITVTLFEIRGGGWRKHTKDKCMMNEKKGGWMDERD